MTQASCRMCLARSAASGRRRVVALLESCAAEAPDATNSACHGTRSEGTACAVQRDVRCALRVRWLAKTLSRRQCAGRMSTRLHLKGSNFDASCPPKVRLADVCGAQAPSDFGRSLRGHLLVCSSVVLECARTRASQLSAPPAGKGHETRAPASAGLRDSASCVICAGLVRDCTHRHLPFSAVAADVGAIVVATVSAQLHLPRLCGALLRLLLGLELLSLAVWLAARKLAA